MCLLQQHLKHSNTVISRKFTCNQLQIAENIAQDADHPSANIFESQTLTIEDSLV